VDKIVISQLVDSDRSAVFDLLQNEQTMRFLGPRRPLTDAEAEVLSYVEPDNWSDFRIDLEDNGVHSFMGLNYVNYKF